MDRLNKWMKWAKYMKWKMTVKKFQFKTKMLS